MKLSKNNLKAVSVSIDSRIRPSLSKLLGKIKPIRKGYYEYVDMPIGGDAPKAFIRLYTFGEGKKQHPKTWPKYIAKVGKKHYPTESIIEYLLNQIGEALGFNMAKSSLRMADNQLRFLSKYFLKPNESLVHGSEIFAAYLEDSDKSFVQEIENENLARECFTFPFVIRAIEYSFPDESSAILKAFFKLLLFDAITGNNDRHFENWGIIKDLSGKAPPLFSPIYDTARGLFWNKQEKGINKLFKKKLEIDEVQFQKYLNKSSPKIGWDGSSNINHFTIIESICKAYLTYKGICKEVLKDVNLDKCLNMIESDFKSFFSQKRFMLVTKCLEHRFKTLQNTCNK